MKRSRNRYLEDTVILERERSRDEYEAEVVSILIDCAEDNINIKKAASRLEELRQNFEKEGYTLAHESFHT